MEGTRNAGAVLMRLVNRTNSHRRDFTGHYKCEHCGHEQTKPSYDDANFHTNVIPNIKCKGCHRTSEDKTPASAAIIPAHIII